MAGTLSILSPDGTVPHGSIDSVSVVSDESVTPLSRSFTLLNGGDASLTISEIQNANGITITTDPTSEDVAATEFATLVVALALTQPGTTEATLSVLHTGSNSPYDITVRWQVAADITLTSRMKRQLKRLCCDRVASDEVIEAIESGIPTTLSGRTRRALSNGAARHNVSLITAIQTGQDVSGEVRRALKNSMANHWVPPRMCDEVDRIEP